MKENKFTIIGVGNPYRSDDGVGWQIAEMLKSKGLPNVEVVLASGEGVALMQSMDCKDFVLLFDAVRSGTAAGTIFKFDANKEPIPSKFFHYSTHAFSVAEAIALARAINCLPKRLIVFGIEGERFEPGVGLSASVECAVYQVVEQATQLIKRKSKAHHTRIASGHA
ncbi:hydrogenase maturation protease [bacterium]|nr:hydrogenase maturation protease [bacterium]